MQQYYLVYDDDTNMIDTHMSRRYGKTFFPARAPSAGSYHSFMSV